MRNVFVIMFIALLFGAAQLVFCAGKPDAKDGQIAQTASEAVINPADFSEVLGKTWELIEVKSDSNATVIDHQSMQDMYTLQFADGSLSGRGAPNRYHGYYTLGNSQDISFGAVASNQMAALQEPEGLKEHEYFAYITKVSRWEINNGQLNLFTANEAGEIVLVFNKVENAD
jgi:heat shock protein HslJ